MEVPKTTLTLVNPIECKRPQDTTMQQPATWDTRTLFPIAKRVYQKLVHQKRHGAINSDWWAVGFGFDYLQAQINAFIQGTYQFSPLQQFQFKSETIRMWSYADR